MSLLCRWGLIACLLWLHLSFASAQTISRLYMSRPPVGSAYVRVINPLPKSIIVRIDRASSEDQLPRGEGIASVYRIVDGGKPFSISVDGRTVSEQYLTPPDRFSTLVLKRSNDGIQARMFVEETPAIDGLQAELRFYNLIANCIGNLGVIDGPMIFEGVQPDENRRRAINPVSANLASQCGRTLSSNWKLPALKPGDHYSLFLIGDVAKPQLVGQLDETEPYAASTR